MTDDRLPWEIIETFPSTDADLLAEWNERVHSAVDMGDAVRAHVGRSLANYWTVQERVTDQTWAAVAAQRRADLDTALGLARDTGDPTLITTALLGELYATWGPDTHHDRALNIAEIVQLRPFVTDDELRLRAYEWEVLQYLDAGRLDAARRSIEEFVRAATDTDMVLFNRREVLWRGCLAMLEGRLDESLRINQDAISSTANVAGSPFSFQNVAITLAVERYLRRGLDDVVDSVRSIRASSPRVAANWDTGLAFALSEVGETDEAGEIFRSLAVDRFARVPRDLNWLVTMQLLGLIALTIDADDDGPTLIELLRPFAHLDGTHGSGYASYGPVGRVVGSLMMRWGSAAEGEQVFEQVLTTRPAGPWTALTLLDRAVARSGGRPDAALSDARDAEVELRRFGLDAWGDRARDLGNELATAGHGGAVAVFLHGHWTLRHASGHCRITASIGTDHLTWLLGHPGEHVAVTTLDPAADASLPTTAASESTLDAVARRRYRRRLDEIEQTRAPTPATSAEAEFLRRELAGGRHMVSNSAELERVRIRVTKALRRTIDHIADTSPSLGNHLRESIETGQTCCYRPADGQAWRIIRH